MTIKHDLIALKTLIINELTQIQLPILFLIPLNIGEETTARTTFAATKRFLFRLYHYICGSNYQGGKR